MTNKKQVLANLKKLIGNNEYNLDPSGAISDVFTIIPTIRLINPIVITIFANTLKLYTLLK